MTKELRSLYEFTGDVRDINTVLAQRDLLKNAEKDGQRYLWIVEQDYKDRQDATTTYDAFKAARDRRIDAALEARK